MQTNRVETAVRGWALLLILVPIATAQQIAIGGYAVPTVESELVGITVGSDGAIWFTEASASANKIGRITTEGAITEYLIPRTNVEPTSITAGPDGALWFTEFNAGSVGRITTTGAISQFRVPNVVHGPSAITAGPDGALWFATGMSNEIGRITTEGSIELFTVPTSRSNPSGITAGPDGALWFTEQNGNKIGRITTSGTFLEYAIPTASSEPIAITAGPDGALWFGEYHGNKIGRITIDGDITEYPIPTSRSEVTAITAGPDGALWFGEYRSGKLGRITTLGAITEYVIPIAHSEPDGITTGPDGELWFTEQGSNRIGQAVFTTATLDASPASGSFESVITFSGSGFTGNEAVRIYLAGIGSQVIAHATSNSNGSFSVAAREQQSPYGPRSFLGMGQTSGRIGAASFSVTARVVSDPNSGAVGSTAIAQGYGFGAADLIYLYWDDLNTSLGVGTADASGSFTGNAGISFTVPAGAAPGIHTIIAVDQLGPAQATGTFTVQ